MMKNINTTVLASLAILCLAGIAIAQTAVTYRCQRCGLTQTYASQPFMQPKCPNDGNVMFRQ